MCGLDDAERASAIDGLEHRRVGDPHHIRIFRIGEHLHVIPAARLDQAIGRQQRPRLARVIRAIQATTLGFDNCIHTLGIGRRHTDTDLAHHRRQPFREALPGVATIERLPDAAALAAAADHPRCALMIPERRIENARIGRIHRQVTGPAEVVDTFQHQLPRRAAVFRAINAALRARLPAITLRGHVHHVRIGWMNAHRGDLPSGGESDIRPGTTLIRAAVHAIAVARTLSADRLFTGADIDHICIRWCNCDGADRAGAKPAVGDVAPVDARIIGAPQPATRVAGEVRQRLRRNARRGSGATPTVWSDAAPLECAERRRIDGDGRGRRRRSRLALRTDSHGGSDGNTGNEQVTKRRDHRRGGESRSRRGQDRPVLNSCRHAAEFQRTYDGSSSEFLLNCCSRNKATRRPRARGITTPLADSCSVHVRGAFDRCALRHPLRHPLRRHRDR